MFCSKPVLWEILSSQIDKHLRKKVAHLYRSTRLLFRKSEFLCKSRSGNLPIGFLFQFTANIDCASGCPSSLPKNGLRIGLPFLVSRNKCIVRCGWENNDHVSPQSSTSFWIMSCVNSSQMYSQSSAWWLIFCFLWNLPRELSLLAVPVTNPAAQVTFGYGCVSRSTSLDPWGSGTVEIATRNVIRSGSVGRTCVIPSTNKTTGHENARSRRTWSSYGSTALVRSLAIAKSPSTCLDWFFMAPAIDHSRWPLLAWARSHMRIF